MHRVRTSTSKFVTGRIRKAKKEKPLSVLRDSQLANILQNGLQYTNTRFQYNSETDTSQQGGEKDGEESGEKSGKESGEESGKEDDYAAEPLEIINREDNDNIDIEGAIYDHNSSYSSFPNISLFLIFIWITKHMIGKFVKPVKPKLYLLRFYHYYRNGCI